MYGSDILIMGVRPIRRGAFITQPSTFGSLPHWDADPRGTAEQATSPLKSRTF